MYIVDIRELARDASSLSSLTRNVSQLCSTIYKEMKPEETLWIFATPQLMGGEFWPIGMAVADSVREQSAFVLKNVISRYREETRKRRNGLCHTYEEILFFVKDTEEYYFDKDAIRVEHVYEGNEWSDRKEGTSSYHDYNVRRYNPKGKDPGNVWLHEIRTKTPGMTVDRIKPIHRNEAIRRCIRAGSGEGEYVTAVGFDKGIKTIIHNENREGTVKSIEDFSKGEV